jgi:hypothetical protein
MGVFTEECEGAPHDALLLTGEGAAGTISHGCQAILDHRQSLIESFVRCELVTDLEPVAFAGFTLSA